MGQWIVTHIEDPPTYEARCGEASVSVEIKAQDMLAYWRAAQMVRANVMRRWEDAAPVFAADASQSEALAFAEMLNA